MKLFVPIIAALLIGGCTAEPEPALAGGCKGATKQLCSFAKRHRLHVISGYRRNARIAGTRHRSNHARGRAIDAHPPRGVSRKRIERAAHRAGFRVGWYCGRMRHLHIEHLSYPGQRIKTWYKGCGRRRTRR